MININQISKQFEQIKAVDQVSFNIEQGEIYGLLGPNGAGKTTIIRMLMGIIEPDSGNIIYNGKSLKHGSRSMFGYLPEERGLYQKQKLEETLLYLGKLRDISRDHVKPAVQKWLERFSLSEYRNRKIGELSKGNQQKVQFILAILHDPEFIVLDEPFTGLDPLNQILLKEIIQEKRNEGKTFIFSTHQMYQVERLCTNICLINKGKVLLNGSLKDFKNRNGKNMVTVKFEGQISKDELSKFIPDAHIQNNEISGVLHEETKSFIHWLNQRVNILAFSQSTPSLEEIFIDEVRKTS